MTQGAVATRNDQNGGLTPIQGSPFGVLGFPATIDAKGRFLFAAGNNSVHMYKADSTMGTFTEVAGSPFASTSTNSPMLIATEPTGTYLAVVNSIGLNPGESSVETFQIEADGQTLAPVTGSFMELASSPIGAAPNPTLGMFFVYLGPNLSSSNSDLQHDGELLAFAIDPTTGLVGQESGSDGSTNVGRSFGADPLGSSRLRARGSSGEFWACSPRRGIREHFIWGLEFFQKKFLWPQDSDLFTPRCFQDRKARCTSTSWIRPIGL